MRRSTHTPAIYYTVIEILKNSREKLSKDEWIRFSKELDNDFQDRFLDEVNEYLSEIAPEIFYSEAKRIRESD
jgi:uncharacterized protein (DUF924 family)